jgi:hypothetical protein
MEGSLSLLKYLPDNVAAVVTFIVGLAIAYATVTKYLKTLKEPIEPEKKGDFAFIAASLADMKPVRELSVVMDHFIEETKVANKLAERGNKSVERCAIALEHIGRVLDDREKNSQDVRRIQDAVDVAVQKIRGNA